MHIGLRGCCLGCEQETNITISDIEYKKTKGEFLCDVIITQIYVSHFQDADKTDIKVQVCVFMFDLLYLNGEPLVKKSFLQRRTLLKTHFREYEGQWQFATALDTTVIEEVQEFLEESVRGMPLFEMLFVTNLSKTDR